MLCCGLTLMILVLLVMSIKKETYLNCNPDMGCENNKMCLPLASYGMPCTTSNNIKGKCAPNLGGCAFEGIALNNL